MPSAVFSQMPHLPGILKPVLSLPSVKSQALGLEDLWGLCSHKNYFTEQFWTLKRGKDGRAQGLLLYSLPAGLPACPKTLQELHGSVLAPSRHTQQKRLQCETSALVSDYSRSNKPLCLSKVFQMTCSPGLNAGWKHLMLGQSLCPCNMIHHFGPGSPGWNHKQQLLLHP